MDFLAYAVVLVSIVWAFITVLNTKRSKLQDIVREAPEPKRQDQIVYVESGLQGNEPLSVQTAPQSPVLTYSEPFHISLPDRNLTALRLDYEPYYWSPERHNQSELNFWIHYPHPRDVNKRWYAKEVSRYQEKTQVLGEYAGEWVLADCTVALVPDRDGRLFDVVLNGVVLLKELSESAALRRRMLRMKMDIKVTMCSARIEGGGLLADGTHRGLYVSLALKPFRHR